MSDKCFVDTNILMYAHDRGAGAKHNRARAVVEELWESEAGVVSTQVLQELYVNLRRRTEQKQDSKAAREIVKDYLSWEVVVNTGASMLEAIEIEQRHGISFWDALIVQAAESSGAKLLYSEDFSSGHRYGSLRVINPLI